MGVSEEPKRRQDPDPAVMATLGAWLDHVLSCDDGCRDRARCCYHAELLGGRHREAARAARRRRH